MRLRAKRAALVMTMAVAAGCGQASIHLIPTSSGDSGTDTDTDSMEDPTDDSTGDVPDAAHLPSERCPEICVSLYDCDIPIDAAQCGAMCARMAPEMRTCIVDAGSDCLAVTDCFLAPPAPDPGCTGVCAVYDLAICEGAGSCLAVCGLYDDDVVACAEDAVATVPPDCAAARRCLLDIGFGTTCADACSLAAGPCTLDVEAAPCVEECNGLPEASVSRSCLDVAVWLDDCDAISECGGLIPHP